MKIRLAKQPQKYLAKVDEKTREKLKRCLEDVANLRGDIKKLQGQPNLFRYKVNHYRIIFEYIRGDIIITVIEINTRTNIKY